MTRRSRVDIAFCVAFRACYKAVRPISLRLVRKLEMPLRFAPAVFGCVVLVALSGCAALLPAATTDTRSPFNSFEAAEDALLKIEPYKTTTAQVQALGFDFNANPNVTLIPYPDVVARLVPNASVPLEALDPGIRDCILAQSQCHAYEFRITRQKRKRVGSFWPDFLNFRRTVAVSGWRFEALIVVRDGVVLFRRYGGEPQISQTEQQVNPLGPLQGAGEAAAGRVLK